MYNSQVIVDKMLSWLGCKEGDPVHKHIIDTYNAYKPLARGYKVKYTDAWCATTVSAAFIECGYTAIFVTECSCNQMIKLLQKKGIWQENDAYVPHGGDVIFYDWQDSGVGDNKGTSEHVGIVEKVENGVITVIEGNKNDGVEKRTIKVNGKYIRGFGVPKYDTIIPTPTVKPQPTPKKKFEVGMDVSSAQTAIDFYTAKKTGIEFVVLRSTTKNGLPDTKFERYYADAQRAGVKVHDVYKYSYAVTTQDAYTEAMSVVKLLNSRECTIWLDLEYNLQKILGKKKIAAIADAFLNYCIASGYDVGIYCNLDWYKNYIDDSLKAKYKFWIARYKPNNGTFDESSRPNVGEIMWQYTSKGKINGVVGDVDLDVRYFT